MIGGIAPEDLMAPDESLPPRKFRGYFIGRRVPYNLLKRAMGLPGKALAVYIALWVLYSKDKSREIKLERKFFKGSGLAPTAITRGIQALIDAWLVEERSRKSGITPILYLRTEDEVQQCEEALAEF